MNGRVPGSALRPALLCTVALCAFALGGCTRFDACEPGRGCRTLERLDSLDVAIDLDADLDGVPSRLTVRLARPEAGAGGSAAGPVVPAGSAFRARIRGFPAGTILDPRDVSGPVRSGGTGDPVALEPIVVGEERRISFTLPSGDPATLSISVTAWNYDLGYVTGTLVVHPPLF